MGLDVVDINGDKCLDVFTGEMLAEDNKRQKTNMAPMDPASFNDLLNNGMHYQFMRNSFHINNGNGHFSDVAHFSGIDKSDWSWSCLFGDYDQDGDEDLLIANGWLRDTQDKDSNEENKNFVFKNGGRITIDQRFDFLQDLNSTPLQNYAFSYENDLKFKKSSKEWGFDFEGFSSGMAYGDLDNDGDLDVIVSNINSEPTVYKNNSNKDNFLKIKLEGPARNRLGFNSKLTLNTSGGVRYKEFLITRGFQSSCDPYVYFNINQNETLEKLTVVWADGKVQEIINPTTGNLTIDYKDAKGKDLVDKPTNQLVNDVTELSQIVHTHEEVIYDDFRDQVLLPHKLSQLGPSLAKGDINGDGLEDVFIGGAKLKEGVIFVQNKDETFSKIETEALTKDRSYEDVAAALFDADGDSDLDLYVVSGSYEFPRNSALLKDRLYKNDGNGKFRRDPEWPKTELTSGSCVVPSDYDNDGDIDIFVGGRLVAGRYPEDPKSYLFLNANNKRFIDFSNKIKATTPMGMVTDAIWSDIDGDDDLDLITIGEWTDIKVFMNDSGDLNEISNPLGLVGWWNTIESGDLDNDGDLDFIVGNLGENYKYKATKEEPFEMFSGDFDNNGSIDLVLSYYNDETLFPVRGFQCSSQQMPQLKGQIKSYEEFGTSDVHSVYGEALNGATHHKANCFSSMILWNQDGTLVPEKLPYQSQLNPIQDIVLHDVNNDDYLDIIAVGNWFVSEVETPRADSGKGQIFLNDGNKKFEFLPWRESGFFAPFDARNIVKIKTAKQNINFIIGNNNSKVQVFKYSSE